MNNWDSSGLSKAMVVSLTVGLVGLTTPHALAQQTSKPLGVLIDSPEEPSAHSGSVLPPGSIFSQNEDTEKQASPVSPYGTNGQNSRPLGGLINLPTAPATGTSSVLPQNWSRQDILTPRPTQTPAAVRVDRQSPSDIKPLGVLFNGPPTARTSPPPKKTANTIKQVRPKTSGTDKDRDDSSSEGPALPGIPVTGKVAPTFNVFGSMATPVKTGDVIPADLAADSLTYDRELGLITARGNVEIIYGDRSLRADEITYNQKTNIVRAEGNASLQEGNGEVIFGDRFDITGDLKDGVIYNIGLLLADRSRVAGTGARRSNAVKTVVNNAVYSPCNLCEDDPSAAPFWQLKAVRIIHNSEEQRIEYRDTWLEVFGVPVAYTPYLSHPDPSVKRRSGLLAPSFSNSSELGFRVQVPYFWAIDEYQDATITPLITVDGGSGAIGEYKKNFKNGQIRANGSFVIDDPDRGERGYIDFDSEFHLNRTWRAGLKVEAASDDTYTRRYGFDAETVLVSRGYLEGFKGNNYQVLNAYGFDDLRSESESRNSPIILPIYDFNYVGNTDRLGGVSSFNFNAMNLVRESNDVSTRRISFRPRWDRPFRGSFGELYNASISLAADGYHSSNVPEDDGSRYTGLAGRILPRAALSWRLPLIRQGERFNNTLEPVVKIVAAPNVGSDDLIPNEDSPEIEFDETNLFSDNLFDGIDRIEGGTRISYGMNWVVTGQKSGSASFFLGQAYRPRKDSNFGPETGLDENFSDIVGRIHFRPNSLVDATYRTQISSEDLGVQRNEVTGTVGPEALQASASYTFIGQQPRSEFEGREELNASLSSQINKNLSSRFSSLVDLDDSDLRSLGLSVVYENECIKLTSQLSRSFFEDRDLRPEDRITFTVVLKTLGEFSTGKLN